MNRNKVFEEKLTIQEMMNLKRISQLKMLEVFDNLDFLETNEVSWETLEILCLIFEVPKEVLYYKLKK